MRPTLEVSTNDAVVVGVQDRRPYVLSGNKPESFVGLLRSRFGIPFDVHTRSGEGLSSDLETALVATFGFNKIEAKPVRIAPSDSKEQIIGSFLKAEAPKALLLTVEEWKTDMMRNTTVEYRLRVELFDGVGKLLARNEVQGVEDLPSHANAAQAIEKKLGELFKGPVSSALQGAPPAGATHSRESSSTPLLLQQVQCKVGDATPKSMTRLACAREDGLVVGQ